MLEEQQIFYHLGTALAVGLLIGVERGWKERRLSEGERVAGMRTYALLGLMGGAVALLAERLGSAFVFGLAFLAVAGLLPAAHILDQRRVGDVGITSQVAGLLTGLVIHLDPVLLDPMLDTHAGDALVPETQQVGDQLDLKISSEFASKKALDFLGAKALHAMADKTRVQRLQGSASSEHDISGVLALSCHPVMLKTEEEIIQQRVDLTGGASRTVGQSSEAKRSENACARSISSMWVKTLSTLV